MEQTANIPLEVATDEPASPSTPTTHALVLARESDHLSEELIESATACSGDSRPGWRQRVDGWTPERIRTFIAVLADTGVVTDAARAAGVTARNAYRFRNSPKGRAFDLAWRAALIRARSRVADLVVSRAINGCIDVIVRDGKVWGERHRFDNRLTMAVLTRLDNLAKQKNQREDVVGAIAQELEEFVDVVAAGGDQAADFIRSRVSSGWWQVDEAEYLDRTDHYLRTGSGLPDEPEEAPHDDEEEGYDADGWQL